jgi:hypothetical protein
MRIAHAVDPTTRTPLTEIDVPNPDGTLRPGTYCAIELEVLVDCACVPDRVQRSGLHLLVVRKSVAHLRKITENRDLGTEADTPGCAPDQQQQVETVSRPPPLPRLVHQPIDQEFGHFFGQSGSDPTAARSRVDRVVAD